MTRKLRFSSQVIQDMQQVLAWTLENFGPNQYEKYKALISLALKDIAADPDQYPATSRDEIHPDARTFHIARKGQKARHFFLFRIKDNEHIEIARLLHDSMELSNHLPPDYTE